MARSKESELSKKLKAAHLLAVKDYWSFRPRAKTGIEYTRKQHQFQDNFKLNVKTVVDGEEIRFVFVGTTVWFDFNLPSGTAIFSPEKNVIVYNMNYSPREAKLNGTVDVDPRILFRCYEVLQELIVDYFKTKTNKQPEFMYAVSFPVPLQWFMPDSSKKESIKLELVVSGEKAWTENGLAENAYAVTLWRSNKKEDEPFTVAFRAEEITPYTILHELTHVKQKIWQFESEATGYPFKHSEGPTGEIKDGNTEHNEAIEFFTYSKDKALEVIRRTTNLYSSAVKFKQVEAVKASVKRLLPNDVFTTRWDVLLGLFRLEFNFLIKDYVPTVGFDEATKRKFISVTYDSAYKQLVLYAKENRVPGAPNA